ncbi:1-(5-phosphoribosyl)-5-((5-phosphoribosylamino)methylideneamino)imidazole-4-carboxamide isomerase [Enterobacteriaceae endosymbiont of Macroplea mutica]|uniref:1-(5-phosphoribosyl)-5-[(5- phosphoribosylamino)methylideneamino]imidazole-4- carboxamide isomerase n=1 Tax=Enterobacteriaceae endosymbiont of Macroplea mutica TaxID=2675791 RepID=UPI00144A2170|nr:1-(5-phosphoribosyl)-5-[(5-phosphoribosylamino)methylideneamino] imidazole-4-carboxamide isomerase [Enterobacteriaceae endosymbiont of Macroplea mutica]QJC31161.1 1-(5-phosphoribosyl)-5-((5-phosphoribosylamino)methylideneamino)imidazole-4-carboxamide isomerase [Enterobacteriaceae endosymbiont of Macroplea mutica]
MIIPSIDLIKGKVVRLHQGKFDLQQTYLYDPEFYIKTYISQGAHKLHIVDLEGAKNPDNKQTTLFKKIFKNINVPIQIGGGIRNTIDIQNIHNIIPQAKIVIGSIIIKNFNLVKYWSNIYKNSIILALDIKIKNNNKIIYINGWEEKSNIYLENIIEKSLLIGIKNFLCTDITKDGTFLGPNINLYQEILYKYPGINLQASGGISSLHDILKLKNIGIHNIIIGKALLEKKFTVQEANSCWRKGSYHV